MKTKHNRQFLLACLLASAICLPAFAQSTAFTYQGRLNDGGAPATGGYDFRFRLAVDALGNTYVGNPVLSNGVAVADGLFIATLDFGAGPFTGSNYWLQVDVKTNGAGGYTTLTPLQAVTPAPYAIFANTASNLSGVLPVSQLSGTIASSQLPASLVTNNATGLTLDGTFTGNGAGVTDVNAATLGGLSSAGYWRTNGNTGANPTNGAFIGTTDNLPLELKVNGQRVLRIEYATDGLYGYSPNMVGGFPGNLVSNGFVGAVIGGGGGRTVTNRAGNHFTTVVGGAGNTASGIFSTAMGVVSAASGDRSTAMGDGTRASGLVSTAMGHSTTAAGLASTAMGDFTTAGSDYSTAMGRNAKAIHPGSFVCADAQASDFASTAPNQFCVRASGGVQLSGDTSMSFGSTLSQKIQLFGTDWGFGIQSGVQYSRVGLNGGFAWYAGGAHSDNTYNPGPSGIVRMKLDIGGLTVNGTFVSASDRNEKENFAPVQPREMLEKVVALPLSSWNYKADTATRHLGPMAQDFYAAFNVGPDDKHIATVDADGVALAAIQGLNQKLETEVKSKDVRISELEKRLAAIEALLQK